MTPIIDKLIVNDNLLYFQDVCGIKYPLPNLSGLIELYQSTKDSSIKERLIEMLSRDLGTLLVIEIMIDAKHPVTLSRLESGEIHKNMKHVQDYYVIPQSHLALARYQFDLIDAESDVPFESCHFAMFPYGLVIRREAYPNYHNPYTDASILPSLLK